MLDPAPARRRGTEGKVGHEGWEGGNFDGNRDGYEGRDEDENGSGKMEENRD